MICVSLFSSISLLDSFLGGEKGLTWQPAARGSVVFAAISLSLSLFAVRSQTTEGIGIGISYIGGEREDLSLYSLTVIV